MQPGVAPWDARLSTIKRFAEAAHRDDPSMLDNADYVNREREGRRPGAAER
jgi:hypothetical protein